MKIAMDESGLAYFEALASYTRLQVVRLLSVRDMNIKELADALDISSSIMTKHIRKLEAARIITTANISKDGSRHKLCSLIDMVTEIHPPAALGHGDVDSREYQIALPVGLFTDMKATAPCGMASERKLLAAVDRPAHLFCPERGGAQLLWIGDGYVEYAAPNYLTPAQTLSAIEISGEFGAPESGQAPTPVAVSLNGVALCTLSATGAERPGRWPFNRHGFLSVIRVGDGGVYVNGVKKSEVDLTAFSPDCAHWVLRLENKDDAEETAGFSIFGEKLGRNGQDLRMRFFYF